MSQYGPAGRGGSRAIPVGDYVTAYLENAGSNNLAVDGSDPNLAFSYTVPDGKRFCAGRFIIYIQTVTNMSSTSFGDLTALTNGLQINIDGTEVDVWKDNIDIQNEMFDLGSAGKVFDAEQKTLSGRWTLWKANSGMAGINVSAGNTVEFVVRDNLSELSIFRAHVQGRLHTV